MDMTQAKDTVIYNVLRDTRKILQERQHWTQCVSAADRNGQVVDTLDDRAFCFCLIGAIDRAIQPYKIEASGVTDKILNAISALKFNREFAYISIIDFNDDSNRKHEEILQVLDKAIERAKPNETN
jgi:hypothetical protein